jgi:hypothetical protein
MKRSPVLLGTQRKRRSAKLQHQDQEDEDGWDYAYDLLRPNEVIIADDTYSYQLFGDKIFTCPQEDLLEGILDASAKDKILTRVTDFYAELGSGRLSRLVKEEYETTTEIRNARKAEETRSRILERLPLFLHGHTHAQTRVSFAWLSKEQNFVVRVFGSVAVRKSLFYANKNMVEKQDASAVALRDGRGPIQLYLGGNVAVDMFE